MIRAQAPRADLSTTANASASIRYVKGVGPRRLGQLAQLGIRTLEDACYYAPRRHEDRSRFCLIRELASGQTATVQGRVLVKHLRRIRGGQTIFEVALGDRSGVCYGRWFNQPYLEKQVNVGDVLILYGRVEPASGARMQLVHPELERAEEDELQDASGSRPASVHVGRIVPIYPLIGGVGQRWLRQVIATIVQAHSETLDDPLPESIRAAHGWPPLPQAVRELHAPSSWEALDAARQRLVFDELFLLQLTLARRRAKTLAKMKPQRYQIDGPLTSGLRRRLPFTLTGAQERVLRELCAELCAPHPMHRLLQGDVGCGKTVVMSLLTAAAVQSGYQAALMAPTELLADQHARVLSEQLGPLGVSVGLLSQGVSVMERRRCEEAIASGAIHVAVGTHALIQRRVRFHQLALVIIDEQHKFGVAQRAHLARKAQEPDVLVVTATPIPRTLALSLYGDLAVSTISELPPGRMPITTLWIREAQREDLYAAIRRELAQGRQGYIVYPLVEERRAQDVKAATQMAKHLQVKIFPDARVGLLHGQMSSKDKERTMSAFAKGDIQLLVSTVIVEVGLDVPNAAIMAIEHPERFGLAQLHQMRGRIGRGAYPATCIVLSDAKDEGVRQRLEAFVQTTDGFQLAEKDLEQRGPGELLGRRQHGWLRFRLADLARDGGLLELARTEADRVITGDPEPADPTLADLRRRLGL